MESYIDKYCINEDKKDFFEMNLTGVMYLDDKNRVRNINQEAEQICALRRSEVIGCRAEEVFKGFGRRFLELITASDKLGFNNKTLRVKINGADVFMHLNVLHIVESGSRQSASVIIMQDVSAIKSALKQIQTTKMLVALGEVAAGVAHHVRTPLTTISGYLQLMLRRTENDKYMVKKDVLEGLLDEVSYINKVVTELVMFAKPAINKKPGVDVGSLLNETLLLTYRHFADNNIRLERQIVKGLPMIVGDAHFIQQAFVNIFQNAFEAMPDGGTLRTKIWRDDAIRMLVVEIEDNGGGISREILPRVFEPFYTNKDERLGLGLPIAYRIIAEHGGFIHLSQTEYGTKVHIYLPIINISMNEGRIVQQQVLNLQ